MHGIRWSRPRVVIAAAIGCLAPLVVMAPGGAAPPPVATSIRVDSIVTPGINLAINSEDVPDIYVVAGEAFTVTATGIFGASTPAPLSNTKDITVKVVADTPGTDVTLASEVVPAGTVTFSFSRTLPADIDNAKIVLTAPGDKRTDPLRTGESDPFDVQAEVDQSDSTTALVRAIGGTVSANGEDCTPTVTSKICYVVHIPAGAASGNHLLSLGNCTNTDANNLCGQDYWWSIVDVNATRTNPAYTDFGFDKSMKGVTFPNGVPKIRLVVRPSGEETWVEAPDCPSKGVVGPDQEFCQDTANNHRDNSGDTWVRLLWLRDIRGSGK